MPFEAFKAAVDGAAVGLVGVLGRSRGGPRCLGLPGGEVGEALSEAGDLTDSRGWVALPEGLCNMPALVDPAMGPPDGIPALGGWESSFVASPMSSHAPVVGLLSPSVAVFTA